MYPPRRNILSGLLSLGLTSCLGSFEVHHLNNTLPYEKVTSQEEITKINFVHLNAADLRGNTPFLFEHISEEESRYRAKWLAEYWRGEGVDIASINEIDYAGTTKTGGLDQPILIAEYLDEPYNYVVFDQYMKSPLWTTGNTVISRFPIKTVHRHLFGENPRSMDTRLGHLFKDFIHTEIGVGSKRLHLITTHFDNENAEFGFRKKEEAQELAQYLFEFKQKNPESYLVAAGDFNDDHDSETLKIILSSGLYPPQENFGLKTYQNGNPTNDLDHILASSNIKISNYRTFQFPWSDHLGLMCELEFLN
ncbi:hypothetical protein HYU08_00550 [Candidatus Woesearchaeota archaeon]|nr:hypothetical protein [Candidatus Woesearchaeota archaeon]